MLEILQKLLDDETITKGQNDSLYEPRTLILLGKEYLATVEGFKVDADPKSLAEQKYYIIVDISVVNTNDLKFVSDLSKTFLSDGKDIFYPVKVTKTEEESRFNRFDLVYSVPMSRRVFEFTFNTGLDSIKKIRFKVDINSLADKIGTPEGCIFFIDEPVEPIIPQQSDVNSLG